MLLKTRRIDKSIARLRKFLKKNPKRPAPETIHKIRTSTRRVETSLHAMDVGKKKLHKRLVRSLSTLRKRLGKVRDMDVLTGYGMSIASKASESEPLVELLEHLGTKRSEHANRLRKTAKTLGPRLRKDLRQFARKMDKAADNSGRDKSSGIESNGKQEAALEELRTSLGQPARLNRSNLHSYRLKVKELRYVLQLSEEKHFEKFVNQLGAVKDAIGEWHDWEELGAVAADVVDQGPQSKLAKQLKEITDERFRKALSITKSMRKNLRHLTPVNAVRA
jgi:CHAD domain-containing protein